MKKIVYIFKGIFLTGLTLLAGACADSVPVSSQYTVAIKAYYIHPDQTSFAYDWGGGNISFTVYSQDTPWEIDLNSDWLTVSPASGSTTTKVTVTAKPNPRAEARNVQFHVKSATSEWSYSTLMSASMSPAVAYATLATNSVNVGATATTTTLPVSSNCDYAINWNEEWINVTRDGDGQITLHIAENGTSGSRTGTIRLSYNAQELSTIRVTQQMPNVTVTTNPLEFGINGGRYTLSITSDVNWTMQTSQSFINAQTADGGTGGEPGSTDIYIEAAPNPTYQDRSGYVYISLSDTRWAQIPISQEGVYLRLVDNATEFSVTARENVSKINIESNAPWTTTGWPDWAVPLNPSGTGNGSIEINIAQNNATTARSKTISLTPEMAGATSKTFTLRQRNFDFKQNETYLECSDFSQTISYHIITDADWQTASDSDWFFTTPASGSNDAEIFVNVQENTASTERNGIAYTFALGNSYPVNIHQRSWIAKYHYDPDPVTVPCSQDAKAVIQVSTNDRWSAKLSKTYDWVHVTGLEGGTGDGTITLTFDANPSINARGVSLEITYEHGEQVSVVPVKQEGRTAKLNCSGIFFFAKGGTSTVAVTADGTYGIDIVTGAEWFSIQPNSSNNTFAITTSENTSGTVREGAVKVYLTNLLDGEALSYNVMVTQTTAEAGFTMLGWEQDEDLNMYPGFSGTVSGWEEDIDLNVYSKMTIKVIGFEPTAIWGKKEAYSGGITVEGYDEDADWNRIFDFNALILTGFLEDENVSYPSTDTGINGEGYNSEDENWD